MSLAAMIPRRCVRWKTAALTLLTLVLVLNVLIFLTLPSSRLGGEVFSVRAGPQQQRYDSRGISHLQVLRKRLNKSNLTSESLGADGGGGAAGGRGGGAAWEEGVGDHPPLLLPDHDGDSYQQGRWGGSRGDGDQRAPPRTNVTDPGVDAFVLMLEEKQLLDVLPGTRLGQENYWAFLKRQRLRRKAGIQLPSYRNYKSTTNWERFHTGIHQHYMYNPDSAVVENLLKDLATKRVIDVEQKEGGTQLKLIITFDDEGQALFKPMRFPREIQTLPDHFYFADFERHIAEIAAFHLDRALGYNRVPPVAGRLFNMTHDIRRLADSKLGRTFFVSPAGNLCFHGYCSYYCDSGHPICGHPDMLEASLMSFLPPEKMAHRQTWRNPWKRSYSKHRKAYWEVYDDLCDKVKRRPPYDQGRRLLDIIDMSVLDFLMGNLDRHHYETFRPFGNDSFIVHLDNGRGFGKSHHDEMSCLAPLLQCCLVRLSTLQRLVRLYRGPQPLSAVLRASLAADPVSPVLIEPHLQALDRRLVKVLDAVRHCTQRDGVTLRDVIVDDGVV